MGLSRLAWCAAALSGLLACVGDSTIGAPDSSVDACLIGNEGCPCTTGGSCNPGLSCKSNVCVNLGGDSGPTDATADVSTDGDAGSAGYTLTFPAQSLSPPVEQTLCITQRLANVAPIHVGSITTHLDPGDFQLAVYLSSATTEQTTPQACSPLGGFTDPALQLVYIGRANDTLTFPSGVGLALAANQMVTIELHQYTASQSYSAGAQVTFGVMSDSSFQNAAALFVQLPSSFTVISDSTPHSIAGFNAIPSHMGAAKVFAITGYENSLGTERKAWNAANANDTSTLIYDSTDPFDLPLRKSFSTPLTFASSAGVSYQCTFLNSTGSTVSSGSARTNETCMIASYYYPSQGFELCFGSTCMP